MPNFVKSQLWYIPERRESFTSRSAEVKSPTVVVVVRVRYTVTHFSLH